jgi:hypothetical protein
MVLEIRCLAYRAKVMLEKLQLDLYGAQVPKQPNFHMLFQISYFQSTSCGICSDIHNTKGKQDFYVQLTNIAHCKKNLNNMGIKIHKYLPFKSKRIENFKVFKIN